MAQPYSQADFANRLLQLFPLPWAGDDARTPGIGYLYTLMNAIASPFATLYSTLSYVTLQTRIRTATDINLDLISEDLFGSELPRLTGETDNAYRTRILNNLLAIKVTRPGMDQVLTNLGLTYLIVEDGNPKDMMSLGVYGGLGQCGHLGAKLGASSLVYIKVLLPLPGSLTQQDVLNDINLAKAEGVRVRVCFTSTPFNPF